MQGETGKVRQAVRSTTPARVVGVLVGGTLGQRAVATLGLATAAFAVVKSVPWVGMILAGWLLCFFAVRDYERAHDG
jgi:hypothetical protein